MHQISAPSRCLHPQIEVLLHRHGDWLPGYDWYAIRVALLYCFRLSESGFDE